jgi:hypothetical protein
MGWDRGGFRRRECRGEANAATHRRERTGKGHRLTCGQPEKQRQAGDRWDHGLRNETSQARCMDAIRANSRRVKCFPAGNPRCFEQSSRGHSIPCRDCLLDVVSLAIFAWDAVATQVVPKTEQQSEVPEGAISQYRKAAAPGWGSSAAPQIWQGRAGSRLSRLSPRRRWEI